MSMRHTYRIVERKNEFLVFYLNQINERFETKEEAKKYIIERAKTILNKENKITLISNL